MPCWVCPITITILFYWTWIENEFFLGYLENWIFRILFFCFLSFFTLRWKGNSYRTLLHTFSFNSLSLTAVYYHMQMWLIVLEMSLMLFFAESRWQLRNSNNPSAVNFISKVHDLHLILKNSWWHLNKKKRGSFVFLCLLSCSVHVFTPTVIYNENFLLL